MLYAKNSRGDKIRADPNLEAFCPACGAKLIPKCGEINIWHWSHLAGECDQWHETETDWHLYFKSLIPEDRCEVSISRNGISHRADIVTKKGMVIELQHSSIDAGEIAERERFYGQMIWLFDIRDCRREKDRWVFDKNVGGFTRQEARFVICRDEKTYQTFRWYHPRKHIAFTSKPTYLDIGHDEVFALKKMARDTPCGGWGHLSTRKRFEDWLIKECN